MLNLQISQVILLCLGFFILGAVLVLILFKDKANSNKEVEKQAFTDPLTGGKNRHMFMYDLDKSIAKGKKFAICFMDLDGFKQINDTMGHDAGDELLINLSKTLNKETVFEGVETKEQRDFLKSIDCDQAQGFFYSRPLSEPDFVRYLGRK